MSTKATLMRKKKDALVSIIIGKTETNKRLKKELDDGHKGFQSWKEEYDKKLYKVKTENERHLAVLSKLKLDQATTTNHILAVKEYEKSSWFNRLTTAYPKM